MTDWLSQYVGIPFQSDGLSRQGAHCWGLVRLVYADMLGIELPSYGENSASDLIAAARFFRGESLRDPWIKVERPRAFDVVLMKALDKEFRSVAGHCGVMIDAETVLHVWEETDSVQMRLDHPRIRHAVHGFYRHKALA